MARDSNLPDALKMLGDWSKWVTTVVAGSSIFDATTLQTAWAASDVQKAFVIATIAGTITCVGAAAWMLVSLPKLVQESNKATDVMN